MSRFIPRVAASPPRSKRATPVLLLAHCGPSGGVARAGTAVGTIGERIPFLEKHNDRSVCGALVRPGVLTGGPCFTARCDRRLRLGLSHSHFSLRLESVFLQR